MAYLEKKYADVNSENDRLREMLELKESLHYNLIASRVLSRDPFDWFRAITISKGSGSGIKVDMPVITFINSKEALVGRIISIERTTSRILLVTDRLSSIPAAVLKTGEYGLIQGNNQQKLVMDYLLGDSNIKIGDEIITSGIGEIFPSGISIGRVVDVKSEKGKYFKQAIVKPSVQLDRIREVFIVSKKK